MIDIEVNPVSQTEKPLSNFERTMRDFKIVSLYCITFILILLLKNDSFSQDEIQDSVAVTKEIQSRITYVVLSCGFPVASSFEGSDRYFMTGGVRIRFSNYSAFQAEIMRWGVRTNMKSWPATNEYYFNYTTSLQFVLNIFGYRNGFSLLLGFGSTKFSSPHTKESQRSILVGIDIDFRIFQTHYLSLLGKYQHPFDLNFGGLSIRSSEVLFLGIGVLF